MQTRKWGVQFSNLFLVIEGNTQNVSIKLGEIQRFNSIFSTVCIKKEWGEERAAAFVYYRVILVYGLDSFLENYS